MKFGGAKMREDFIKLLKQLPFEFNGNCNLLYNHPEYPFILTKLERAGYIEKIFENPKYPVVRYRKIK